MSLELETLRAYADGELPPQQRAEIEAVLASDAEQAAVAAAMFASRLPYRSAFEQQALPPVPAELQARRVSSSSDMVLLLWRAADELLADGRSGARQSAHHGADRRADNVAGLAVA